MENKRGTKMKMDYIDKCYVGSNGEKICKFCGCTEQEPCDGGCSWIDNDVCSNCKYEKLLETSKWLKSSLKELAYSCSLENIYDDHYEEYNAEWVLNGDPDINGFKDQVSEFEKEYEEGL